MVLVTLYANSILLCAGFSDVDPDPVDSGFIWVRGSGFRIRIRIQRYKMKGIAEFNQQFFAFFFQETIFFKSKHKKVANL